MSQTSLRIGIWFDEGHVPFGGPSLVFVGTLLGLYQWSAESGQHIIVLFNETGDVNWSINSFTSNNPRKLENLWCGPLVYNHGDVLTHYENHDAWKTKQNVLFPSVWFADMICTAMPYKDPRKAEGRRHDVWPSGVDVDYFCPSQINKTQDYFIYYKSQTPNDLQAIQQYLFDNWFGIKGTIMTYYFYDKEMLRNVARSSKFCIMLDNTETQGLAALEIMATGCPLFVCDAETYTINENNYPATSVTNMDNSCGIKSTLKNISKDFPTFIENLETYTPRNYVVANYSFKAAAGRLLDLIAGVKHKTEYHTEKDKCVKD
jgi:hypothetical protein